MTSRTGERPRLFSTIEGPEDAPVVMMHTSLACSHRMWDRQAAGLLAAGRRVLRYDLRGHGQSQIHEAHACTLRDFAEDAVAVLADHGLSRVAHVGLSLGGMIAMWLAENQPDVVDSLFLCSTSARLEPAETWLEREALVEAKGTSAIADVMAARWITPQHAEQHPEDTARIREEILSTSASGYVAGCHAIATMDIAENLTQIQVPTMVVAGAQDAGTPPEHAEYIAASIRDAGLTVLDPGAHLLTLERPDAVTELIVAHLETSAITAHDHPTTKG